MLSFGVRHGVSIRSAHALLAAALLGAPAPSTCFAPPAHLPRFISSRISPQTSPFPRSVLTRGGLRPLSMAADDAKGEHSSLSSTGKGEQYSEYEMATRVVKGGFRGNEWTTDPLGRSVVNPPVYHASTVTYPNMAAFRESNKDYLFSGMVYGRHGTPTSFALEEAFSVIEGGDNSCVVASGVAAINAAMLAFLKAGDHVLVSDGVYGPTRSFCDIFLKRFQVETTYYDPCISAEDLQLLFRPNTKVLFMESPSSLTFELHDFAALASEAHKKGAAVIADNTYGPLRFRPLQHGANVSINAGTKYISGHSDAMIGLIACDRGSYRRIKRQVAALGCPASPDDCYLALRGVRTLALRLNAHEQSALRVAEWLEQRPEVVRVLHPALPSHPQHALFKRDFSGSCGLFSFQLSDAFSAEAVDAFTDSLKLFAIGYSWGGFESLVIQCDVKRSANPWNVGEGLGATLRLHIGLEDVTDLIRDLKNGFGVLADATAASGVGKYQGYSAR